MERSKLRNRFIEKKEENVDRLVMFWFRLTWELRRSLVLSSNETVALQSNWYGK